MKLKKGDTVRVITGKDKGKEGVVQRVFPSDNKVIVNGVSTAAKHQRPRKANQQAGIIEKEMPMPLSRVMLICKSCSKPTRVGFILRGDGKHRICKKCGQDVD